MTAYRSPSEESTAPFPVVVKDELARCPVSMRCCLFTETAVTLRLAGTVALERGGMRLVVLLDHGGAARRLAVNVAKLTAAEPTVTPVQGLGGARWVVWIETGAAALARAVGLCDGAGRRVSGIPRHVMVSAGCCQAAAWRAAVLAAGTISSGAGSSGAGSSGAGKRRLRVNCPDLLGAKSLAMLAHRIAGRAWVPAFGPPQVVIEVADDLGGLLRAIGVSPTTVETLIRPVGRPRASA